MASEFQSTSRHDFVVHAANCFGQHGAINLSGIERSVERGRSPRRRQIGHTAGRAQGNAFDRHGGLPRVAGFWAHRLPNPNPGPAGDCRFDLELVDPPLRFDRLGLVTGTHVRLQAVLDRVLSGPGIELLIADTQLRGNRSDWTASHYPSVTLPELGRTVSATHGRLSE